MADFASEGGHWYYPDGRPCYTVIGANGKERDATLRDARKLGLFPGVTTITRCAAAPQLEAWKRKQLALACLTLPRIPDESEDDFLARAERDAKEEGEKARDRGTDLHAAIEGHFRGDPPNESLWPWVQHAKAEILEKCGRQAWSAERSVAHPCGYGTKIDLHSAGWVIDHKSKDGDLTGDIYSEHWMQLAAGRRAVRLDHARCGILFVRRDNPQALLVEVTEEQLHQGLAMFDGLLAYWRAKNRYAP